jgi:hypothetical protein
LNTNATTNTLSKDWKLWKKIFDPSRKLEKKNFYHLQIFYYTTWNFTWNLQQCEKLFLIHLKLHTFNNSKSFLPHTSNFQWIEELCCTHFQLETWYFQKTWRTSFSHLKNLQNFEEISSTRFIHLEMDFYSLCNLAN